MNAPTQEKWLRLIESLEEQVTALKDQSVHELKPVKPVGLHPITDALAAIEGLTWGLKDCVSRWPTTEDLREDQSAPATETNATGC